MKRYRTILAGLCVMLAAGGCGAQTGTDSTSEPAEQEAAEESLDYPEKTINCIVPYAAGGGSDVLTRSIMSYMDLDGQSMVATNIDGGSGLIGAMEAANSRGDGYTMLAHNPLELICLNLSGAAESRIWDEMQAVCFIATDYCVVTVNPDSGYTSIEDFAEACRENPGEKTWGFVGTRGQLASIQAQQGLETEATLVPYSSGSDAVTAVMGGHVDVTTSMGADAASAVLAGEVVPILVIGDEPWPLAPDVPTTADLGFEAVSGQPRGYYVPGDTDERIVKYLSDAMQEVSENEEFIQAMEDIGLTVDFVDYTKCRELTDGWYDQFKPIYDEYIAE